MTHRQKYGYDKVGDQSPLIQDICYLSILSSASYEPRWLGQSLKEPSFFAFNCNNWENFSAQQTELGKNDFSHPLSTFISYGSFEILLNVGIGGKLICEFVNDINALAKKKKPGTLSVVKHYHWRYQNFAV